MLLILSKDKPIDVIRALQPVLVGLTDKDYRVVQGPVFTFDGATAILGLGTTVLEALQSAGAVPKNRTVTSLRRQVVQFMGRPTMITYSTGIAEVDYQQYVDLLTDVNLAVRLAKTGTTTPKYGDYQYVPDFKQMIAEIKAKLDADPQCMVDTSFDTETLGLDRFHKDGYLIALQFSHQPGTARVVAFPSQQASRNWLHEHDNQMDLHWLLNCPRIRICAANGKYDLEWLYEQAGITCTNFRFDTTLVGSLLDENRSNGLDVHAKVYVPDLGGYSDEFDKAADKSRMDLEYAKDPEKFLLYSGGDADATLQVKNAQKEALLQDPALTRFYVNLLHPAARAFEQVERGGVLLDMNAYTELESDLRKEMTTLVKEAKKHIGGLLVAKHQDLDKVEGLNITKASLLIDVLFSPQGMNLKPNMMTAGGEKKAPQPSTAMDHLQQFADHPEAGPFIKLLGDYGSASKMLSTYVTGFKKHIRSDGRYHPSYFLFAGNKEDGDGGTNTGRPSVRDPAFQCMVGETVVTTSAGPRTLLSVVRGYERGERLRVLTHTGRWKPVAGVYRNGVKEVFSVSSGSGIMVKATANHPVLTARGWVRTDELKIGDTCYAATEAARLPRDADLSQLGGDEEPLQQPHQQRLAAIRWAGNYGVPSLAEFSRLLELHGAETGSGMEHRARGRERQLRAGQLHVGEAQAAGIEQDEHQAAHLGGPDEDRGPVGGGCGDQPGTPPLQTVHWFADGPGFDEDQAPDRSTFQEDLIVSIRSAGYAETFDLTIQDSHSFVANGLVVHNTIPKHNKWAKAIRRCYPAPEGYLILETDYSQGELRVVACVANEATMIAAYAAGMDLHVVTGGSIGGYTYEEMQGLKVSNPDLFDQLRQQAKAGNFGLLYGMGVDGFIEYARGNYGVTLSHAQAEEIRSNFFNTYPGLVAYHEAYKAYAHKHGYVRSPLGRVRHLPLINSSRKDVRASYERKSINSPIQGALSDMMIWSVAEENAMGWHLDAPCFGTVHDASYRYIPEDNYEFYAKRTVEVMEGLPLEKVGWSPQLKFIADAKVGRNMADLVALGKFKP